MQIAQALFLAVHLEQQLAPAFERLVVAGSVRRRKTNVKDIELVGLARYGPLQSGLFSDQESRQENLSEHQLPDLLAASAWAIGDKNGPRYKQLVNPYHDINCDLFILHDPAEWGVGLTIR
ncbi:MAG: hypothetical protein HND51_23215, partial [Chloroflexi bacterium]|nr:hypothetical protein [Chloroflexota bacterium]NOH14560.1 hypothetical protein [Chloroflexota bacterium]